MGGRRGDKHLVTSGREVRGYLIVDVVDVGLFVGGGVGVGRGHGRNRCGTKWEMVGSRGCEGKGVSGWRDEVGGVRVDGASGMVVMQEH